MPSENTIRIKDQPLDTELSVGDYVIVDNDNVSEGTRKFDLGKELRDIKDLIGGGGGSGMSTEFKQALHNILEKVAFIDEDGQDYLNALDNAMYPPVTAISLNTSSLSFATLNSTQQLTATTTPSGGAVTWSSSNTSVATVSATGLVTSVGYGSATITATSGSVSATCSVVVAQATLSSISAVYTQSGTVYDSDSLDSLKSDLVVTAHWSNSTTSTVESTAYTLSGTLTEGTSTVTVTYGGKTTTFNVVVTHGSSDTTAEIEYEDYVLEHVTASGGKIINTAKTNGGITIKYEMDNPTNILYPAGIIPTLDRTIIGNGIGALVVYDSYGNDTDYVYEYTTSEERWAQLTSGSPTEFSKKWTLSSGLYSSIAFSVDMRYLDDAYMYDYTSGKIWFAGVNTPYYGMAYVHDSENVTSISCSYTQSGVISTKNALDDLRQNLVVTAVKNGTSTTVENYSLRGALTVGTSTITVYYGGKTATFTVTVTNDTTVEIAKSGYVTKWQSGARIEQAASAGGITKKYTLPASSILYPAGILVYDSGSLANDVGIICIYNDSDEIVGHVSEKLSSNTRWAQLSSGTPTEYSQSWDLSGITYTKIEFSVDTRYVDDSYMYDMTTGQVFFAGINTPYYGMSNISEANS